MGHPMRRIVDLRLVNMPITGLAFREAEQLRYTSGEMIEYSNFFEITHTPVRRPGARLRALESLLRLVRRSPGWRGALRLMVERGLSLSVSRGRQCQKN